MKSAPLLPRHFLAFVVTLSLWLSPVGTHAQIATGQGKFLGNIIAGSVPSNFGTYWNQVTPENSSKWGSVESTRNIMNWSQLDTAYNYARTNGFKFKAHTLVWGAQYPAWITTLSEADQRAEIEEWIRILAERYPDTWAIDVVNEPVKTPLPFKNALGGDGATGWDWVITSFQIARQRFPNAKLFLNEYGTENDAVARGQMIAIVNLLKARSLIDGIGIQGHYFNLDNMTAAQMTACLDAYAATGLDLYLTELDLRGPAQTEASQSAQYQVIFPAIWTHASVKGVTLWGYIEGQTWRANTGILNSDGSERAAMAWLKSYVTGSPTITTQPASQTATAGTNVSFSVAATGTAPLSYQWKFNDAAISGATNASYGLTNVQASNAGSYTVTASNSAGSITSNAATLTVNAAPPPSPPPSSGGGGGGGAVSPWFIAILCLATLVRLRISRARSC